MSLKILLADDNMTAQNTGRRILADAGYSVIAVSNGAAALKKFASEHPDILVLDVFMPGYSGLEVCEKLKAECTVPVLLSFSRMEPFRPEDGDRVRADGYVAKPFDATELLEAVARLAAALANGQQQSAHANGVAAEITTAEYTEPTIVAAQPEPVSEFTIERNDSAATEEHSAIGETPIPSRNVDQEEVQPIQKQPPAALESSSSNIEDSWERFDRPSGLDPSGFKPAKFEPDGDAAKVEPSEKKEAGFFAFSSRSLFTAASVEHFHAADSTASRKDSVKTQATDSKSAADATSSSNAAADTDAASFGSLLSGNSPAPTASDDATPSDTQSTEWWKSAESNTGSDLNAALAAAEASTPTPAADLNFEVKEEPAAEEITHEADQPADFHSVLAQLLPTATTSASQSNSGNHSAVEWPVTEAIMGFDGDHDLHAAGSEATEPGISFETLTSTEPPAEPGDAIELTQSATPASHETSSPASSHHISEAIERVLGRFKESLLSEVIRELSTK